MIVCDSDVALLALLGTLDLTSESLATTSYELYRILIGLQATSLGSSQPAENQFTRYVRNYTSYEDRKQVLDILTHPDPAKLLIFGIDDLVVRAAQIETRNRATPHMALVFALAERYDASILYGPYCVVPEKWARVARELRISAGVIPDTPVSHDGRGQPRIDRRRPRILLS